MTAKFEVGKNYVCYHDGHKSVYKVIARDDAKNKMKIMPVDDRGNDYGDAQRFNKKLCKTSEFDDYEKFCISGDFCKYLFSYNELEVQ